MSRSGESSRWFLAAAVALLAGTLSHLSLAARPDAVADSPSSAQPLVASALRAELAGRNEGRTALLDRAIGLDPEYAPARWQSGQMRIDGQWMTVEEAQRLAAGNKVLRAYRNRRAFVPNESAAQAALARWCAANNLPVEAQVHWYNVLRLQPQNQQALQFLGLQKYRDELLTRREIERREALEQEKDRVKVKWRPVLAQLRRGLASADAARRKASLEQLLTIDDPAVIPALEEQFSPHDEQLACHAVRVLSNIDSHDAVISLLRHAVFSQWDKVRIAAADALAKRPMHDYVPYLLDELAAPYESSFQVHALPGGYTYQHVLSHEGPFVRDVRVANQTLTRTRTTINYSKQYSNSVNTVLLPTRLGGAARSASMRQAAVAQQNRRLNEQNQPYLAALRRATTEDHGNDPRQWWTWWQQYNEIHVPANKPTRVRFFDSQPHINYVHVTQHSCFLRGTKVWTSTGLMSIESIQLGDRVLAQNPETGELAFKPVLATTLRPPADMIDLNVAGESIKTTRGHPFWLDGHGWRMAKLLEAGGLVHGLHGAAPIEGVSPAPAAEAHNLVVADFHNYFVGETGLLVHDNTSRAPTTMIVPGLKKE